MNAIDKLKSDLERYHKALTQIRCDYASSCIAHQLADAALNPPPPPPVTLDTLREAAKLRAGTIELFGDGSVIWRGFAGTIHSFSDARTMLEFLEANRPL